MKKTLERIINYAVAVSDPEEVILFGSMVNGKPDAFSDVDLLIVCEDPVTKRYATEKIRSFCKEYCLNADILIYTNAEIKEQLRDPVSFMSAVMNHGRTVYKKNWRIK